ncbi:hypothetical protein M6G65_17080 [Methylobacterium tardum]|uniref:hypothetical protein n=1 Tax=Methylobacterium tardum TaxID=374432 RepID=UPI00202033B7|nr:hypothetical protein [Methylobacterium tardum]URD34349.1 hypothetical protein M6G65_17080 [Methylobacterium tardum]
MTAPPSPFKECCGIGYTVALGGQGVHRSPPDRLGPLGVKKLTVAQRLHDLNS